MKSIRIFAVAAALASVAACGKNDAANNVDANASLETENLDAGLNSADVNATSNLDTTTDVNATDLNASNTLDTNVTANATTNNSL